MQMIERVLLRRRRSGRGSHDRRVSELGRRCAGPHPEALQPKGGFDFLIRAPFHLQLEALIVPLKKISQKAIPMITTDTFLGDWHVKPSAWSFPLADIGSDKREGRDEVGKKL